MDKALFRAYVKELVKEQIEESVEKAVKKILPELLAEAVAEVKGSGGRMVESAPAAPTKPTYDRSKFMAMMGMDRVGDTITATTRHLPTEMTPPTPNLPADDPTIKAINRDYSQLMKAMKLT